MATLRSLYRLAAILVLVPGPVFASPPDLSAVRLLPGNSAMGPAAGVQETPDIAMGASGVSLAVWTDSRTALGFLANFYGGPYFGAGLGSMRDIYAVRLDASGNPVDPVPIIVCQAMLNQGTPRVAWNGQNWLVVWKAQSGMACCPGVGIWGARVAANGVVLDPQPIRIDPGQPYDVQLPEVGSDGTNWLVVWQDRDGLGNATLDATRLSPTGVVLDPGGVHLRQDTWNSYPVSPEVVWATDEYLLTWIESAGNLDNTNVMRGQRFTATLQKLDPAPFTINLADYTDALNSAVATDGTNFFAVWFEDRYYGWAQLFGARINHSGLVLDPNAIEITSYSGYSQFDPSVAWDGSRWIVAYNKEPDGSFDENVYATRVSTSGVVQDPAGVPIVVGPDLQNSPAIAAVPGGGARIVWMDRSAGGAAPEDILSARILANGTVQPAAPVALGAPRQSQARMAAGGPGYLMVFRSEVSGSSRILGQRLDPLGNCLDLEPFVVATGALLTQPDVAWNGSVFLVVWNDPASITVFGRRFDAGGAALDAAPVALLPGDSPAVAALEDVFLVVSAHEFPNHIKNLKSIRVRGADGARLDPSPVVLGGDFARSPAIRALGNRWLVAWERYPTHDNPRSDIEAMLVNANNAVDGILTVAGNSIVSEVDPAIAVGSSGALILWSDGDIQGRRISVDGTFAGTAFTVSQSANTQAFPSVAWNGNEYVAAWRDDRNMAAIDQSRGDIFGARISADGAVFDALGFAVETDSLPQEEPAVAAAGGNVILAFSTFRPEPPYSAVRIGYRTFSTSTSAVVDPDRNRKEIQLSAPYPNPAAAGTVFRFLLVQRDEVRIDIFDLEGRPVRALLQESLGEGRHEVTWDGLEDSGAPVPSGIYLYRFEAAAFRSSGKITIMR